MRIEVKREQVYKNNKMTEITLKATAIILEVNGKIYKAPHLIECIVLRSDFNSFSRELNIGPRIDAIIETINDLLEEALKEDL